MLLAIIAIQSVAVDLNAIAAVLDCTPRAMQERIKHRGSRQSRFIIQTGSDRGGSLLLREGLTEDARIFEQPGRPDRSSFVHS